eukprot:COSAG04_NODE_2669_length_3757_cov_4.647348_7_plen_114_part_00
MKQAENLFRRAMGKMLNASTASCFEAWATKTAESLRQKELVTKVMRRFRNIHLSQCYNQVRAHHHCRKRLGEVLARFGSSVWVFRTLSCRLGSMDLRVRSRALRSGRARCVRR